MLLFVSITFIFWLQRDCRHVFCWDCANSLHREGAAIRGNCKRCQQPVKDILQKKMGEVFICEYEDIARGAESDVQQPICSRAYFSPRDLEAHVNMRHRPQLQIAVTAAIPQLQPPPAAAVPTLPAGPPLFPLPSGQPLQPLQPPSAAGVGAEMKPAFLPASRGGLDVDLRALASAAASAAPVSVTFSCLMNNSTLPFSLSHSLAAPPRAPATLLVNPAFRGALPPHSQQTAAFPPGAPGALPHRPEVDLTGTAPHPQRPVLFPPGPWDESSVKPLVAGNPQQEMPAHMRGASFTMQQSVLESAPELRARFGATGEQSAPPASSTASVPQSGAPTAATAVGAQRDPRQNRAAASRVPATAAAVTAAQSGAPQTSQPHQSSAVAPRATLSPAQSQQAPSQPTSTSNLQQPPAPGFESRLFLLPGGQQPPLPTYYKAPTSQGFTGEQPKIEQASDLSESGAERKEELVEETASEQLAPPFGALEEQQFYRPPMPSPQFFPGQQPMGGPPPGFATRGPPPGAFFAAPPNGPPGFGPMGRPFFPRPMGFAPPAGAGPIPPGLPHWQSPPRAIVTGPMPGRPPFRQPPFPPRTRYP